MDKKIVLHHLLGALSALDNIHVEDDPDHGFIEQELWAGIKELCGFVSYSAFDTKILEHVKELLEKVEVHDDNPYDKIIDFLLTTKIEETV